MRGEGSELGKADLKGEEKLVERDVVWIFAYILNPGIIGFS